MEASDSQIHIFTSLHSFSDDAQEQFSSKFRTNTAAADIPFEWIDNKHLRLASNNEASVTVSFNLYADFIHGRKYQAYNPLGISKHERSSETFTEKMNAGAVQRKEANSYNTNASLPVPVAHGKEETHTTEIQTVPKTVEEWVTMTLCTAKPPFGPLEPVEDPGSQVTPVGVHDSEAGKDEDIDAIGPKKRFGKCRKKPALEDIDDIELASKEYLENHSLSSRPIVPLESTLPDTSVPLASTLSRSHNGSLLSLQPNSHSGSKTPSIQNSTACQDLLTGTDIAITYPVISPTPAKNGQNTTLLGKSKDNQAYPPPPVWLSRKITAEAESGRSRLLIDALSASGPRASYAVVAKRATGAALGLKGPRAGLGGVQGRTYGEPVSTNQREGIKQTATNPSSIVPTADTDTFW
ncbi:MAG: hypothetical protein Q9182_006512 [Xanthomendoza sp. 2 TL-2023]